MAAKNTKIYTKSVKKKKWSLWCLLCAKADAQNIDIITDCYHQPNIREINISAEVEKFFHIQINQEDYLPQVLCTECISSVKWMAKFALRVSKVQEMYNELQSFQDIETIDLMKIREKYGISDEEPLITHPLTSEAEICEKYGISDGEPLITHPLTSEADIHSKSTIDRINFSYMRTAQAVSLMEEQTDIQQQEFDENNKIIDPLDEYSDFEFHRVSSNYLESKRIHPEVQNSSEEMIQKIDCRNDNEPFETYMKNVSDNEYYCNECERCIRNFSKCRAHINKLSDPIEEEFPNTEIIVSKMASVAEKNVHTCSHCNETFQRKASHAQHLKAVHGVRGSFVCEMCGEILGSKSSLRDHKNTHTKDEVFTCIQCGKGFKNKALLKKHIMIHGDKHICAECGLQLSSRATLYSHLKVHSDAMPHKCDYCGRAFKRSKTLKRHLMVHNGLKPYSCDFCSKSFSNSTSCRQHKKNIHPKEFAIQEASGEKPPKIKNIPKLTVLKEV